MGKDEEVPDHEHPQGCSGAPEGSRGEQPRQPLTPQHVLWWVLAWVLPPMLGSPHAGSCDQPPRSRWAQMFSPNNPPGEPEVGGQAVGRALKGGRGKQGQRQQFPRKKPPTSQHWGRGDAMTPPESHVSCLVSPCPLSTPSHHGREQEHPPRTLQI